MNTYDQIPNLQVKKTVYTRIENETESQYIERLTADYKAKMSDATPPALFNRAISFIQAMFRLVRGDPDPV